MLLDEGTLLLPPTESWFGELLSTLAAPPASLLNLGCTASGSSLSDGDSVRKRPEEDLPPSCVEEVVGGRGLSSAPLSPSSS